LLGVSLVEVRRELGRGAAVVLTLGHVVSAWSLAGGLVDAGPGKRTVGNHAVLAVGILNTGATAEQVVIKNSWGGHWGAAGYGFVSARYLEAYGIRVHVLER